MQVLKPATIAQRIGDQINTAMIAMTTFFEPNEFRILRWSDELNQLMKANAMEAHRWHAILHHMTGNVGGMELSMQNASRLGLQPSDFSGNLLIGYANLTMASKALPHYRSGIDVKYGNISGGLSIGLAVGLFQRANELLEQLGLAVLRVPKEVNMDKVKLAAQLLRSQGVTDEVCATVVDAAGEVLRERKLFWLDQSPEYFVNDVSGTVGLQYRVSVDHSEAALMTMQTAEKLIERNLDTLPFYVTFLGAPS